MVVELAWELREMAQWLELDEITIGQRGDLAAALGAAVSPAGTVRKVLL